MSDVQIQQAARQFEMMADHPEMMEMAREQLAGLSGDDLRELQEAQRSMFGSGGGSSSGGGGSSGAAAAAAASTMPTDPTQLDPTKMDPAALKKVVGILRKNPSMVRQMAASASASASSSAAAGGGMAGAAGRMSDEALTRMLDAMDGMSEDQIQRALGMMGKVQRVLGPVLAAWRGTNRAVGGRLGAILLGLGGAVVLRWVVGWAAGGEGGAGTGTAVDALVDEAARAASAAAEAVAKAAAAGVAGGDQDEFAEEL